MTSYNVKRLSVSQISDIVAIIKKVLTDDFPEYESRVSYIYRTSIFTPSFFKKIIKDKTNAAFGVFVKKDLAGIIVLKSEFGGGIFVEWLAVKKQYRNSGIGDALLNQAQKWALEHKNHFMYLYTESKKNIAYYTKRGFVHSACFENSWFGATEHIMSKQLRHKPFEEMFKKYLRKKA